MGDQKRDLGLVKVMIVLAISEEMTEPHHTHIWAWSHKGSSIRENITPRIRRRTGGTIMYWSGEIGLLKLIWVFSEERVKTLKGKTLKGETLKGETLKGFLISYKGLEGIVGGRIWGIG